MASSESPSPSQSCLPNIPVAFSSHPFVTVLAQISPIVSHLENGLHTSHPQCICQVSAVSDQTMSLSHPNPVGDFRLHKAPGPNLPARSWPQRLCQPYVPALQPAGFASRPPSGYLPVQDPAQGMLSPLPFRSQGHHPLPPQPVQSVLLLWALPTCPLPRVTFGVTTPSSLAFSVKMCGERECVGCWWCRPPQVPVN